MLETFPSTLLLILTTILVDKTITDAHQYPFFIFFFSWTHRRLHFSASPGLDVALGLGPDMGQKREVVCATLRTKHLVASGDPLLQRVMEI